MYLLDELTETDNQHQIAAEVMIGCRLLEARIRAKALFWFERAVQHDFRLANLLVGSLYYDAGSPLYDIEKATYWLATAKKENIGFLFSIIETGLYDYDPLKPGGLCRIR